jgi:hypothetical protein
MSLFPLRRWRHHEEPPGLPAPGPFPPAQPPQHTTVIFVVIVVLVAWLLTRGYSPGTALEIVAGAGVLTAGITSQLAGTQADER